MVPPNSMASQFGKYHQKNHSCRLIFDLCDMWPESFPVKGMKPLLAAPFSIWAGLRNRYMKYADLIMSECDLFADMIRKYVPDDIVRTFWLCRRQIVKEVLPVDSDSLTFAYVGSLNHVVDVDAIVKTLAAVRKHVPLKFHIIGDGESRQRLLEMLDAEQIDYDYHGLVFDEEEKRKIFAKCHYGFNMMRDTACIGLTMKSLDYFAYDIPILNNVPADTWKMVADNNLGFNISTEADIEKILSVKEEDYQKMRHNVLAFHAEHLSEEQFKAKLASYL
jgi:glycosyltransferase involved in cell wall biosynthesis